MKQLFLLLSLLSLSSISFADELDEQINKACLRHAVSLVANLKTEVVGELSKEKSDRALQLATESCQAYFKKEFSQNTAPVTTAKNEETKNSESEEKGKIDWLTEKILSGDDSRKEGNKRLKRIK